MTDGGEGGRFAAELREKLQAPIYNRIIKKFVGKGELEYEIYLHTNTLLGCQYPPSQRVIPEELMFQIVHQAQELWLKLLVHEGTELVAELDGDALWGAAGRIERMIRIQRALADEIRILATLTPEQFQVIRRSLGTGSGQESPGYNQLTHVLGPEIEAAVGRLLARKGITLASVYQDAPTCVATHRICEELVDLDEAFQGWLTAHFFLVRRTIGINRQVNALDGFPTNALAGRMIQPLFPSLWDVRIEMTKTWRPEGGYPVGADRSKPPETAPADHAS